MLLFAAEFPASSHKTTADVLAVAREWLCGSPHYPWTEAKELDACEGEITEFARDGQRFVLASVSTDVASTCGARHVWRDDEGFEWTTEIVGSQRSHDLWVSVHVHCNVLTPGLRAPVAAKKPYIIKLLLQRLGGGADGPFMVDDKPRLLTGSDIDLAVRVVDGTADSHLPVVYVSVGLAGRPMLDYIRLAKTLSGAAHVVVEPDRYFSRELARRTDSENVFGGGVGLYWPGHDGPTDRFLPRHFADERDLVSALGARLREGWLYAKADRGVSWSEVIEAISRNRIAALRDQGSTRVDDYVAAFDAENAALKEQLAAAKRRLSALQNAARGAQLAQGGGGLLVRGREQDLYDAEVRDAAVWALGEALSRTADGSRKCYILKDLIEANPKSGEGERLEEGVRKALGQAMDVGKQEVRLLEELGFSVDEGGKHYRATFGGDQRLVFTIHKTASDHRTPLNLVSEITKKLFK